MKSLAAFLMATAMGSAFADYSWIGTQSNTADAPFDFTNPDYWDAQGVPASSTASRINITNVVDGYRFITVPDDFTFDRLCANNSCPIVLLGSCVHTVYGFEYIGSGTPPAVYLYATSEPTTALYVNHTQVCGDIVHNNKSVFQAAGHNYHRLDLYATAAGETRRNPSTTYAIGMGYTTFHIFAPHGTDADITSSWRLSNGSAIAFRAEGQSEHVLPAGTIVTAATEGILPAGTFLKRIFPDGSIELSNPATLAESSADVALTFAAFTADVEQDLWQLNNVADSSVSFDVSKHRAEDRFVYRIRSMDWKCTAGDPLGNKRTLTFTSETGIPGCIETTDVYAHQTALELDNCHLQFENPRGTESNAVSGFRDTRRVTMSGTSARALITVTNGITAYFAGLTKIDGAFRKDGAGRLIATFGNDQTAGSASANAGSIAVEAGTMDFVCGDGSDSVSVATLSVSAGATVQLPENGTLTVTTAFTPTAGATISGPGVIVVPNDLTVLAGVTFANGASVSVRQSNAGRPIYEQPKGVAPAGTPAFWADASQGVTADGAGNVTRWDDCRGADGYMFATNVASVYPSINEDQNNRKFLRLVRNAAAAKTNIADTAALVWNVPLSNIRAVFAVVDLKDGGGVVLGSSPRISTHDYWRNGDWGYWNQVLGGSCSAKVSNGKIFTNGESIPAFNVGFPYAGYGYTSTAYKKGDVARPICISMLPTGDTEADCFGFCNYEDGCNGNCRLYEYVIYTNALTTAERLETEEYLMKKWMAAHANYDRLADVTDRLASLDVSSVPALDVADGEFAAIDTVSGAGSLVKTGDGTLYVEDLVSAATTVEVKGGTLNLRSVCTTADTLPVSPVVHFDASDAATLTATTNGDVVTITEMRDRRGSDDYPKAVMALGTSLQLNAIAELGGRTMADFGPYLEGSQGKSMKFWKNGALFSDESLRTTVSIIGTAQGGGFLAGETSASKSYHDYGGIWRNATSYENPIVSTAVARPSLLLNEYLRGNRTRLNGEFVIPKTTGFSGGYDIVSLAIYEDFGADGICAGHYGSRAGGQEFGEQMLFDEALSREQILAVEAYLKRKWRGADEPAYRGSRAAALKTAAGTTVNVYGDSPFVVSSLSGAGVVNGAVRLADSSGELVVTVDETGAVSVPACSGFDFTTGGTLRFAGTVRALKAGRIVLMENVSAPEGVLSGWTVVNPAPTRGITVQVEDGDLVADVTRTGLRLIIK